MTTAVANPQELPLKKFLIYSLVLHGLLVLSIAASILFHFNRDQWSGLGGTEGSVNVKLSGPMSGIPMPTPPDITDSKIADPSKGLWKELPQPKPPKPIEPPKVAEKIPAFKNEKRLPPTKESRKDKPTVPPPDNIVPSQGNGTPNLPTGIAPTPGAGTRSVAIRGEGGGDFASRYAWYIEAVKRRVNQSWIQSMIDPALRASRQGLTVMTFTINRDGSIRNVRMVQSSGNLSMDNSAKRALDGIQFAPLPNDFAGSAVDVTFNFDLSLTN